MPKLDDYDDSHAPISATAQTSIANKVTSGTSTLVTATPTLATPSSFGSAPASGGFGSTAPAASGFGAPTGGFGSTAPAASGFGAPTGGFGSTAPTSFGSQPLGGNSASSFGTSGSSSGGFGSPMGGMGQTGMGGMPGGQAQMLQSTGGAMQEGGSTTIETSKGFGDFINSKWRPMMAVIYMLTCFTDFILFPVLWSVLQALFHGTVTSQWAPLTLQGAGLYHIAMGAVLGLAAYGRSQEKIAGKA